jgi:hypothetical protein
MATDIDARRLYPKMVSERDIRPPTATTAPSRSMADLARRLYPTMKSNAPAPSPRTERAGFYKRVLTCDMTGPNRGRLYYVDMPISRTL